MPAQRKAREIIGAFVHLLHERNLRIHQAAALQNSIYFRRDHVRFEYVLEHRLNPHAMERFRTKWKVMSIDNRTGERRGVYVGTDNIDLRAVVQNLCAVSDCTSADDQNARPLSEEK